MKIRTICGTCCTLLVLSACSPSNDETPTPKLFKGQRNALDKAKTVEPIQQEQDARQRKAIEQQTQ